MSTSMWPSSPLCFSSCVTSYSYTPMMTLAGTTAAITPVHAGSLDLNGHPETESFRPEGVVNDVFSHHSTSEEEDALIEREEDSLMMEDAAKDQMFSVALGNSVVELGGNEGESAERHLVLCKIEPSVIICETALRTSGVGQILDASQPATTHPYVTSEAPAARRGSDVKREGETALSGTPVGTLDSSAEPACIDFGGKRPLGSSRPMNPNSDCDDGGVWLGTRKRKREKAQHDVVGSGDDCSSEGENINDTRIKEEKDPLIDTEQANPPEISVPSKTTSSTPIHRVKIKIEEEDAYARTSQLLLSQTSAHSLPALLKTGNHPETSQRISSVSSLASTIKEEVGTNPSRHTNETTPSTVSYFERTHSVVTNDESESYSMPPPTMPTRSRIFSVDLDPTGFDFESSMGVVWNSPSVPAAVGNADSLPPIAALPSCSAGSTVSQRQRSVTAEILQRESSASSAESPCVGPANHRDRGLSFDLFSFGVTLDEPLANTSDGSDQLDILNHVITGRPRGDSIIFDPISFSDGGIHEESALMRTTKECISMDDKVEIEIMNSPGFVEAPASCHKPMLTLQQRSLPVLQSSIPPKSRLHVPSPLIRSNSAVPSPLVHSNMKAQPVPVPIPVPPSIASSSTGIISGNRHRMPAKASSLVRPQLPLKSTASTLAGASMPTMSSHDSGSSGTSDDNIINMPHGSAAAAAMAAPSVIPSSLNGTPTSHTACPMELLNKGGRIGIYLPEARKARIAKFHSKRKMRIWRKRIKYDCRKKLADSRPRIKGRFVKRSDMDDEEKYLEI